MVYKLIDFEKIFLYFFDFFLIFCVECERKTSKKKSIETKKHQTITIHGLQKTSTFVFFVYFFVKKHQKNIKKTSKNINN